MMGIEERVTAYLCDLVAKHYMKRPGMADFLHTKFFSLSGIRAAVRNELAYRKGNLEVPAIRMAAFELTNTCNLKCSVCSVNNGMKRARGFMDIDLFRRVLETNREIEIAQLCLWGEPLIHPRLLDFVSAARERNTRSYLYTNGTLLDDEMSMRILKSGLHRIFFSLDGYGETYSRIRGHDYHDIEVRIFRFLKLRQDLGSDMRVGVAMVACEETAGLTGSFRERWLGVVDEIQITPHITHEQRMRNSRCRLLWLGYPIVLWDGRVVPCCVDYEGTLSLGDVHDEPDLKVIWNGRRAVDLRKEHLDMLYRGVCGRCHEYRSDEINPRFDT